MSSSIMLKYFVELATVEGICIKTVRQNLESYEYCHHKHATIVLAVTQAELNAVLKMNTKCQNRFVIILLENNSDVIPKWEYFALNETYIIIPWNLWSNSILYVKNDFSTVLVMAENNVLNTNVTLDFIQMSSFLMSMVNSYVNGNHCSFKNSHQPECVNFTIAKVDHDMTEEHIFNVSQNLHLDERSLLGYVILQIQQNQLTVFAETKIRNHNWVLEFNKGIQKSLNDDLPFCDFSKSSELSPHCNNCSNNNITKLKMMNKLKASDQNFPLRLKDDVWVPSILTICIIGVISCGSVFAFMLNRIYKRDLLEGNPCPSVLLVLSTILMYISVMPYCITLTNHYDSLHCALKLFGTPLSYTFVFSVILSRTLMILTCDYNGSFMSHINGYLQSFLCFFIALVQVSLLVEFGSINWLLLEVDYCLKFTSGNVFLLNMSYNSFLLGVLISITPFVVNSKRNYKEGICFIAASFFSVMIWVTWCLMYIFCDEKWKDFSVAFGLSMTASVIVTCIFIPRTYLIMNAVVRDKVTSTLPSYNYMSTTNILNAKCRSNQELYDTVNVELETRGETNIGFYGLNSSNSVTDLHQSRTPDIRIRTIENSYENYMRPSTSTGSRATDF